MFDIEYLIETKDSGSIFHPLEHYENLTIYFRTEIGHNSYIWLECHTKGDEVLIFRCFLNPKQIILKLRDFSCGVT